MTASVERAAAPSRTPGAHPTESAGLALLTRVALVVILLVAAFVRFYRIDLTWYFLDQVRDVSTAVAIASGQAFPLVGPLIGWTSGKLGPLYFYLISPPFLFTGNPMAGFAFVALLNVLAVYLCFRWAARYFGVWVALVASALLAVFPLAVFSSRVLWNPGLVPLFTILFMRALYALIVDGRSSAIVGLLACLAILTQIHLTTVALGAVAALALLIWRPRLRLVHCVAGLAVFALLYGPYLIHELTHRFENVRAIAFGGAHAGDGPRALSSLLVRLATLYRSTIDGFVVVDPWPPLLLGAFSTLYTIEALLFCLGVAVCVWQVARPRANDDRHAATLRATLGLLLLWIAVPVGMLGMRRTALWWYYFDLLYPSQFVFAGLALHALVSWISRASARRAAAWAGASLVVLIAVSHVWFQVGLQRRIDRQGELLFDVPRFSVTNIGSALGVLTSLPYGYRTRLLRALSDDFGITMDGLGRVHGTVIGKIDENDYLLRRIVGTRGRDRKAEPETSSLVTMAAGAGSGLDVKRSDRVGPYTVLAYRPMIEYPTWRCSVAPRGAALSERSERRQAFSVPAPQVDISLNAQQVLSCEGTVRVPEGRHAIDLGITVTGSQSFAIQRVGADGRFAGIPLRSWQSPSLYWLTEGVLTLDAQASGPASLRFAVMGGNSIVTSVDIFDLRAR